MNFLPLNVLINIVYMHIFIRTKTDLSDRMCPFCCDCWWEEIAQSVIQHCLLLLFCNSWLKIPIVLVNLEIYESATDIQDVSLGNYYPVFLVPVRFLLAIVRSSFTSNKVIDYTSGSIHILALVCSEVMNWNGGHYCHITHQ
jgi:hypothetical protein